ncbi:hypothetical protein [Variovorax soli]|uniref:Uncharacterized protein n=1 Tax=Variovorax soli TaxID=376815 RepID=A0ABU1NMP8_9BURK|nr:hypothetical protein [Variovorax soli]MDR6539727.1 hypothetical protein [Variovorax soli]
MSGTKTPASGIRRLSLLVAMLGAAILPCLAVERAAFAPLNGAQIRSVLQGKVVSDDRHWAHHYLADGRLMRLQNGRLKPGQWMVQHDELCFLLPEVSRTEPVCFQVARRGNELQYLDGERVVYESVVRSRSAARMFDGTGER